LSRPDRWLRGPVEGIPPLLQPAAHALVQALEDVERATAGLDPGRLWSRPGKAASIGFHLKHLIGATDRLLTYGRGEPLSEEQKAWLKSEGDVSGESTAELVAGFRAVIEAGLAQLRATSEGSLTTPRAIGRARLPTTVQGCLFHAAEHAARHAGQMVTTARAMDPS
jgi:uncharacterized damage-inducible protein DinB